MLDDLDPDDILGPDWEPPEFFDGIAGDHVWTPGVPPNSFRPFALMSAEEWHHIEQAALFAHAGRIQPAERARELAGYGGLTKAS